MNSGGKDNSKTTAGLPTDNSFAQRETLVDEQNASAAVVGNNEGIDQDDEGDHGEMTYMSDGNTFMSDGNTFMSNGDDTNNYKTTMKGITDEGESSISERFNENEDEDVVFPDEMDNVKKVRPSVNDFIEEEQDRSTSDEQQYYSEGPNGTIYEYDGSTNNDESVWSQSEASTACPYSVHEEPPSEQSGVPMAPDNHYPMPEDQEFPSGVGNPFHEEPMMETVLEGEEKEEERSIPAQQEQFANPWDYDQYNDDPNGDDRYYDEYHDDPQEHAPYNTQGDSFTPPYYDEEFDRWEDEETKPLGNPPARNKRFWFGGKNRGVGGEEDFSSARESDDYDSFYNDEDYTTSSYDGPMRDVDKTKRRRRKWMRCICCCLLLLLLMLLIIFLILFLKKPEEEPEIVDDDDDDLVYLEDDFIITNPYDGVVTTPMDPYEQDDCFFADNQFPHVIQQCQCFGAIDIVPNDTATLYYQIRQDISREIYGGSFEEPIESCDNGNQALIWLSSGDTRDSGDLFQRYVMAMSFIQLNGTTWDLKNQWLSDGSECMWMGLQCNSRMQVNSFALDTNNIHGSIPDTLYKMRALKSLSITSNHLTGTVPPNIFRMRNLEYISLYANNIRGSIPTEIGLATNLKALHLQNNLLWGKIVTEIGQATSLEEFNVGFNEFWRRIPTELGKLANLKKLILEDNRLSGRIPTEFSMMTSLEQLRLGKNLLVGILPPNFERLTNLTEVRVANSGLNGQLSTQLGKLTNLNRLELGLNQFVDTIPTELGLLTGLSWLSMNGNHIYGTIPTELGNLVNMTRFSLQDTWVNGSIPTELSRWTRIEDLMLDSNLLKGTVPTQICELRARALNLFVTNCPSNEAIGVICSVPDCCTFCRRGSSAGPQHGHSSEDLDVTLGISKMQGAG